VNSDCFFVSVTSDGSGVTLRKARSKVAREIPRACAAGQSPFTKAAKDASAGTAALARAAETEIDPVVCASAGAKLIRAAAAMTDRRMMVL